MKLDQKYNNIIEFKHESWERVAHSVGCDPVLLVNIFAEHRLEGERLKEITVTFVELALELDPSKFKLKTCNALYKNYSCCYLLVIILIFHVQKGSPVESKSVEERRKTFHQQQDGDGENRPRSEEKEYHYAASVAWQYCETDPKNQGPEDGGQFWKSNTILWAFFGGKYFLLPRVLL